MERHYYIPLCSKDFTFENIFSSESISPINFYSKRGFGIDYFYPIQDYQNHETLILFNNPPIYSVNDIPGDVIKFILAITETAICLSEIIAINEGLIGYQKTIYLNQDNFKILCFSESDKKTLLLKSEGSLPTKSLKKYSRNFEIISENSCVLFDVSAIKMLNVKNEAFQEEITFDRHYNFFKGFIYGVFSGIINTKSPQELKIKQSLQNITNTFAEFKNRSEGNLRENSRYSISKSPSIYLFEKKLRESINESYLLFLDLFPESEVSEKKIATFVFEAFKSRFKSQEEALQFVNFQILSDELFETSNFQKLKTLFSKKNKEFNPLLFYYTMTEQIEYYASKGTKESVNDNFKDALHKLSNFIESRFLTSSSSKRIDLTKIKYNPENNSITIDHQLNLISDKQTEEFVLITNDILHHSKFGKGEATKESLLTIVESVGARFSKTKEGKTSLLFQYLNNEISSYSIEKASSNVMKNFVAFVFNPNSIEKLINFIDSKEIENEWMAFAFWGAYNGFANLSKNFVRSIFDTNNHELQKYIDNYLTSTFYPKEEQLIVNEVNAQQDNNKLSFSSREKEFYDKYIHKKHSISLDEFVVTLKNKKQEAILEELKEKYNINKTSGKSLIKHYKEAIDSSLF